jgi:hypothetical protein
MTTIADEHRATIADADLVSADRDSTLRTGGA